METRHAGASRLRVTPLGLGLAAVGRPGYITEGRAADLGQDRSPDQMQAAAHAVLDAAWDAGIRYFDAARSYGSAEAFLAGWLEERGLTSDDVTVASKWGYRYTAGWRIDADVHEVKDHSVGHLREQLAETQSLLGGALGAYQIHSATLETGVLSDPAVLAELARLRDAGVVVGFTTSGAQQADVVRHGTAAEVDGRRLFGLVQATWNLLEPSVAPALAEAADAGLVVVVKEALANGRLTARGDGGSEGPLAVLASRMGTTPDAVALAAVMAQPWCDVALSGAVTPDQVRANLAATEVDFTADDLTMVAPLAEPAEFYWQARAARAWR